MSQINSVKTHPNRQPFGNTLPQTQSSNQSQNKFGFTHIPTQSNHRITLQKNQPEICLLKKLTRSSSSKERLKETLAKQRILKNKIKNAVKKNMSVSFDLINLDNIQKKSSKSRKQAQVASIIQTKTKKVNYQRFVINHINSQEQAKLQIQRSSLKIDDQLKFEMMKDKIQKINKNIKLKISDLKLKRQYKGSKCRQKPIKKKKINEVYKNILVDDWIYKKYQLKCWLYETCPHIRKIQAKSSRSKKQKSTKINPLTKQIQKVNFNLDYFPFISDRYSLKYDTVKNNQKKQNNMEKDQHKKTNVDNFISQKESGEVKLQHSLYFESQEQSFESISVPFCCSNNKHGDDIFKMLDESQ